MTGESSPQTPAQPIPPQEGQSQKSSEVGTQFYTLLNEAAKFTVIFAFALYALGFTIWHAYLAKFGAVPVEFIRADYFSAALCYMAMLVTFATPPTLLVARLHYRLRNKEVSNVHKDLEYVVYGWYAIAFTLINILLSHVETQWSAVVPGAIFSIGFTILVAIQLMLHIRIYKGMEKPHDRKILAVVGNFWVNSTLLIGFVVAWLLRNPNVSKLFLLVTTLLPLSFLWIGGFQTFEVFRKSGVVPQVVTLSYFCFVLIGNAVCFGATQFGTISKVVGGGKPEIAFLKLSPQTTNLVEAIDLPTTNHLVGPIAILLRSEHSLLFLNADDLRSPLKSTNATCVRTNITAKVLTNGLTVYATNLVYRTNLVITEFAPSAKQIRLDDVQGIIFKKE